MYPAFLLATILIGVLAASFLAAYDFPGFVTALYLAAAIAHWYSGHILGPTGKFVAIIWTIGATFWAIVTIGTYI